MWSADRIQRGWETYADSQSLRLFSLWSSMRSDLLRGAAGASSLGGSFAARSAWACQSSSSQASGTFCAFGLGIVQ